MVMEKPAIGTIDTLAASAESIVGNVHFIKPRTFTATCRVTYHASATAAVRLNLYFSPDAENYDTVPYAYFDVDLTAAATVQETHAIDAPEEGYMKITVQNLDAVYPATGIKAWVTIQEWEDK